MRKRIFVMLAGLLTFAGIAVPMVVTAQPAAAIPAGYIDHYVNGYWTNQALYLKNTLDGGFYGPYAIGSTDNVYQTTSGTWQQIVDIDGKCVSYDNSNNTLNEQPCGAETTHTWQYWASKQDPNTGRWWIWNEWEQINHGTVCGNNYQPVITVDVSGGNALLACPKVNSTTYSSAQSWSIFQ